ncbi:MAG: single-stranded-DNA-specific exonuclease RecJ [Paludibacteraceae bacterium]|nr:single-stranded-DNA-specific exonuclease RecJ [Paludibacteraceae bacterium]
MNALWDTWKPDDQTLELCDRLAGELNISLPSAKLLAYRGITSAEAARAYIRPSLDRQHDPMLMRDMDKAVLRLSRAVRNQERVLIYGDYDVDGTTAVALVYRVLRPCLENLFYYIPDRYTEGYGISFKGVDYAAENRCSLIIALDCGIKEMGKVEYARERGIDFIICDHHPPGETSPDAVAVLNMLRKDCPYPYKGLSGCGVGYKLMLAWLRHEGRDEAQLLPLLQLLAMSIASDIMPLTDENRLFAHFGLKEMNTRPLTGIRCLAEVAKLTQTITMSDLQYRIGPRINASGRIYSGAEAVELLITDSENEARTKAQDIDNHNSERRDFQDAVADKALEMLAADPDNAGRHVTVVYSPEWNKGVVGIAASRLIETYYRPTIVLTASDEGFVSGSARSVAGYNIYNAIDTCRDLLTHFGGHAFAAGVTLPLDRLEEFKARLEDYVARTIRPEQLQPVIRIEQEICFEDITPQFCRIIQCLEPFGPDNPRPVFATRRLINNRYTRRVGKGEKHLHVDLTDTRIAMEGIAFGMGDWAPYIQNGNPVDACYTLEENTFNGRKILQLRVQDLRQSSPLRSSV